jgi:hypothetical protein
LKLSSNYNGEYFDLWTNRAALNECITEPVLEFDDGILGYCLDVPTMSGLRYALDRNAYKRDIWEVANERGFRVAASLVYPITYPPEWKYTVLHGFDQMKTPFTRFERR